MSILDQWALRGPNVHHREPVIQMRLDMGVLEGPMEERGRLLERLRALLPSLEEASGGTEAPPADVEQADWAARLVGRLALALQRLMGTQVEFCQTFPDEQPGHATLVYAYEEETLALQAGRDAVHLVEALAGQRAVDLDLILQRLRDIRAQEALGPSTGSLIAEARRRGIPTRRLDDGPFFQLGHGARQQRIHATLTSGTSVIASDVADDKLRTKRLLQDARIPVPAGRVVTTLEEAVAAAFDLGWPVAVKPLIGNHGRGITALVEDQAALESAFAAANEVHRQVLVERHVEGHDYRLLVIDGKLVAAARRDPAQVVGDGVRTVRELVEQTNEHPSRGDDHETALTRIRVDGGSMDLLRQQDLDLHSVPAVGQVVRLKSAANLSSGGTATDVTDEVHPAVRALAERVARLVGLDVIGIDMVAPTLAQPLDETGGGIVEVNAAPGFRMHVEPTGGLPRDVASPVIDMLFPGRSTGEIPIVAVTGTNGKTTTARLVSHLLREGGAHVGLATTTGVEVDGTCLLTGDYSGPDGAMQVLGDPLVDHAVLEVARGGILRRGLGFQGCDVGILLNVAADHLGDSGIHTLEDLTRVKAVVVNAVKQSGTAVLNADDPRVLALADDLRCHVALISLAHDHPAVTAHVAAGGWAVVRRENGVVLRRPEGETLVARLEDVPLTLGGRARFNVQNVMAAVAAVHALGLPLETIRAGLAAFHPTPENVPGRMNLFEKGGFRVIVDYGHNAAALEALRDVVEALGTGRRINVGSAAGNRRDEDILDFGRRLAEMYHHILLSDPDPRQRAPGETPALIQQGILSTGFPSENVQVVANEAEAIAMALRMARPGDLVVLQADDVAAAIRLVREGVPSPAQEDVARAARDAPPPRSS